MRLREARTGVARVGGEFGVASRVADSALFFVTRDR